MNLPCGILLKEKSKGEGGGTKSKTRQKAIKKRNRIRNISFIVWTTEALAEIGPSVRDLLYSDLSIWNGGLVMVAPKKTDNGPLAQWIRRRPPEPEIPGSSPGRVI